MLACAAFFSHQVRWLFSGPWLAADVFFNAATGSYDAVWWLAVAVFACCPP